MQPLRIAVIYEPTWHIHREALLGVVEAINTGLGWNLEEHWPERIAPGSLAGCAGAVGAFLDAPAVRAALAGSRPPMVGWGMRLRPHARCVVQIDDAAIGRLAAEHLLSQGYDRFAVLGHGGHAAETERRQGFTGLLRDRGLEAAALEVRPGEDPDPAWLRSLPDGTGILAATDDLAVALIGQIDRAGRRLGEHLGVLGVNGDPVSCARVAGRLSSIRSPWREMGDSSARLLARLIAGEAVPETAVRLPPGDLIARDSTRRSRPELSDEGMIAWIALNAHRGIDVRDLIAYTGWSRRTIERQIMRRTGRTPADEIRHARIALAKGLLRAAACDHAEVARRCGFSSARALLAAFRAETGQTPAAWAAGAAPR